MIELQNDGLVFRFPEVHPQASCTINFMRTFRLPDDDQCYPLPPGMGFFPLATVDELGHRAPNHWNQHGGVFFPMYQSEAMWIAFDSGLHSWGYPFAIKVAAGKINALTGETWGKDLTTEPQDYLVVPEQPWLDGFAIEKGTIRQFVAMPLGKGYTAEEQSNGEAEHGGLQILAYPMKEHVYQKLVAERARRLKDFTGISVGKSVMFGGISDDIGEMGLAPGGRMRQEIFEDPHGIDAWDTTNGTACFVHLANSQDYYYLTGRVSPTLPPTSKDYTEAGLPWFEYYAENLKALPGSEKLAQLYSVAKKGAQKGETPLPENDSVTPLHTLKLGAVKVREGQF